MNALCTGSELVRKKSYVHPVKKNAVGPSEAFTQEESQCLTRNDAGFATESQAYTREVYCKLVSCFNLRLSNSCSHLLKRGLDSSVSIQCMKMDRTM